MKTETTMNPREALAYAKKHNLEAVRLSEFTNRWPNLDSRVGQMSHGRRIVAISDMNSSGECFALLEESPGR